MRFNWKMDGKIFKIFKLKNISREKIKRKKLSKIVVFYLIFLGQPEFNTAPDEGSAGYAEGKTLTLNYGFGFGFI